MLDFRILDLVDIALVAGLLFAAIAWLRRTRARFASIGIGIVGAVYLVVSQLDLQLTAWILQGFFAVVVLIAVVVFQEDLRRLFEWIAIWGMRRRAAEQPADTHAMLVRAVTRLAATNTGALVVIPGREPLERHVEGGIELRGRLSEPLLLSLFDASSPGHDGAVIVSGQQITRFAVHLPLSTNLEQLGPGGTRHAAALGLSERCDATCIVVSEERGTISLAAGGELRVLRGADALAAALAQTLRLPTGDGERRGRRKLPLERWPEALAALGLALGLWLIRVPGSGVIDVEETAPVVVENLPEGMVVEQLDPPQVRVTLSGTRRALFFARRDAVKVRVDAVLASLGRRTFRLAGAQVDHPPGLEVVAVEPESVRLHLREDGAEQ